MALPIAGIFASAAVRFVKSKLGPKDNRVSLGEAVVGEAVTRLVPDPFTPNPTGTMRSLHNHAISKAGQEFGDLLLRAIPEGKFEEIGERSLGRFLKAAGEKLDPIQ